jgi:hypothetical protein
MARINLPSQRTANLPRTHEGAVARRITPFQELKRSNHSSESKLHF